MSRCSIILVHGTWGRGFFLKISDLKRRYMAERNTVLSRGSKRWFEDESTFRARLNAALENASLDWPIRAFLWSGANSVHARDGAARELSDQLRKDLADPDATVVIIAHSHGGNLALRAVQHLNSMAGRVRIVTLATPFLRVFSRRFWQLNPTVELLVRLATAGILCLSALLGIIWIASATVSLPDSWFFWPWPKLAIAPVLAGVAGYFIGQWLIAVYTNTDAALAIEKAANYGTVVSRMLVIRGVDDEASLSLAVGSVLSRLGYLVLVVAIPAMFSATISMTTFLHPGGSIEKLAQAIFGLSPAQMETWALVIFGLLLICSLLGALIFLFVPGAFKCFFFGREFLVNALLCDIAVDSVPDTLGQVDAITLKPIDSPTSDSELQIRHGIYNHPDCVDEIVRWLRRVT
jgi:hypothetical protein